jgi:cytochrome c-type biogenesis protein CcmH
VCQNQNLADSDADLAKDLRDKVYEMIKTGSSDAQIVDYMVDRYGDFVLYRPPVNLSTIFLWLGPFIILLACLWILIRIARRRVNGAALPPDQDQHERAQRLLGEE